MVLHVFMSSFWLRWTISLWTAQLSCHVFIFRLIETWTLMNIKIFAMFSVVLVLDRLRWLGAKHYTSECCVPPPSAFLVMRDVEVPAVKGERNSEFLCYSVADFIFSRGCPQPCFDSSQQFRSCLVLPCVAVPYVVVAERWYSREKPRKCSKAFDTAWKGHVVVIL